MKIALYVPSWPPGDSPNGIVTYASHLVPALRRLGHEVYVITPHNTTEIKDRWTIDLQRISRKATIWDRVKSKLSPETARFNIVSAKIAATIRGLVENEKLDVFEIEESSGWNFAVSRLNLLPVVVRLHGPWFVNGRLGDSEYGSVLNRRREEREGLGIRNAHIVTSPSVEILRAVKDQYGVDLNRSRVIPNPIQTAFEEDTWSISNCCDDNLLFVGRFDKRKGGDLVLRAFAGLAARYPRLKLTFVGPDRGINEPKDKIYSFDEFICAYIPEFIRPRIEFLGAVSHSRVMSLRVKCFATIIASRYEIMPYSVLEAMSLGCPLIATAVGGVPELITDHRNGLLVPSEDVKAMTDACETLLCDKELAARLGSQAWCDCQDLYSPDNIAKQTAEVYRQAIDEFKLRNSE